MNKLTTILALLLLVPFIGWAHGDKSSFSLSGVITDESARPVSGAVINIEKNGEVIQSTETDAEGNFELKMDGIMPRMDQLKFTVQKKGYKTYRISPVQYNEKFINIQLHRQLPIPIIKPIGGSFGISV